ncbi:hypothetical protein [Rhizobium leguminosarum]|uniref:hypothetical protein n=1 Tax=Rhizobium leguminosarum TaxID=384 RepID=UPI0013EE95C0|nr:hypothetical protein [Rhizobium leguminosarum]
MSQRIYQPAFSIFHVGFNALLENIHDVDDVRKTFAASSFLILAAWTIWTA